MHESFESRSFIDALEQVGADSTRLAAFFDEHDIRRCDPRPVTDADGRRRRRCDPGTERHRFTAPISIGAYVYATVTTDSFDETAQGLLSELEVMESQQRPLLGRLAEWVEFAPASRRSPRSAPRSPTIGAH